MILLINYYIDKNPIRQKEIDFCLEKNIGNPAIKSIVVFHDINCRLPKSTKIIPVKYHGRPTYSEYFKYGNNFNGVKILANSDIYFNETIRFCDKIKENQVYALTRWQDGKPLRFYNKNNSQDVWVWRGSVNIESDFGLGVAGCDNKIAYLLQSNGYDVSNPSLTIQAIHYHRSEIRNYRPKDKLPGPYMNVRFHAIDEVQKKINTMKKTVIADPVDVVYVLGKGSHWKNNEIRYSLRSVEKNLTGYRNIYIIGENPGFLRDVIHIQHPDEIGPQNADGNIARKVLRACAEADLSDNFLFINDDHIILSPVDARKLPAFHKGDMADYPPSHWNNNLWRKRLRHTFDMLKQRGLTTFNFDCHTPILFSKESFRVAMGFFDYENDIGYTMKSMYGNVMNQDDGVMLSTEKKTVFQKLRFDQIESRLRNCLFMSFNDDGLNAHLKKWLWMRFPGMSKYETSDIEDFYTEVLQWMAGDRDYKDGANLFAKYIRRSNINKLFNTGETPVLREKLEFKFKIILQDYER